MKKFDPIRSFANLRHEFGEHGGVNMSVEASTTFTVIDPETMPEIFQGHLGPDVGGCYLYGRHFNPTVYVLGRQIAAYEGAEAGYCTASGMAAIRPSSRSSATRATTSSPVARSTAERSRCCTTTCR